MPTYSYKCDRCNIIVDIRMSFDEHSKMKDLINCKDCNDKMYQTVQPLNFRLKGDCWFSRDGGNNSNGVGYGMTDNEMAKNREETLKVEDYANTMASRDENIKEV